jgi:hypothetical protein
VLIVKDLREGGTATGKWGILAGAGAKPAFAYIVFPDLTWRTIWLAEIDQWIEAERAAGRSVPT